MTNHNGSARRRSIRKATLSMLAGQHSAVQNGVIRATVVHWFDRQMIEALTAISRMTTIFEIQQPSPLPGDLLMVAMESLPFIESHGEGRLRVHADVRQSLLGALLQEDRAFVDENGKAAIDELYRRNEVNDALEVDEAIELAYLLLAIDDERGKKVVDDLFDSQIGSMTVAPLDRLIRYVDELRQDGRLSVRLVDRSKAWAVWAASAAGDYRRAAALGELALADLRPNADLFDVLTYDVAFARWQLGERDVAADLAEGLAERRSGKRLGAYAKVLIGDMGVSRSEPQASYFDALGFLLTEAGIPGGLAFSEPKVWQFGEGKAADNGDFQPLIGVEDSSGIHWIMADRIFAEVWLRLGAASTERDRLAGATAWLELADGLFQMLGDADGAQRTWEAQQTLAARYGDRDGLRAVITKHEAMLEWARATNAAQVELRALFRLAAAHSYLDDLKTARDYYEKASVVAASLDEPGLSAFAAQELARIAIAQGQFEKADLYLRTALEGYETTSPDEARRLDLLVGDRWLAVQRSDSARLAYERLLEWASSNDYPEDEVQARLRLAVVAEAAFDLDEAERQLTLAAAFGPRIDPIFELDVLIQQARVLRLQSRDGDAATIEERIEARARELSVEEMFARLLLYQGETASRRNEHVNAVASYRAALRHYEDLEDEEGVFDSLSGLASELSDAGEPNGALEAAERMKEIATRSGRLGWESEALFVLGTVLVGGGQYDAAIVELLKAHRQNEADSSICTNLGWAYLRAGQFERSLEWSNRALALDSHNFFPYRNIGHALLGLGRLKDAKKAYAKAIEERFGDENFRNTLEELDILGRLHPGLNGLDQIVAWFQGEQAKIDASNKT